MPPARESFRSSRTKADHGRVVRRCSGGCVSRNSVAAICDRRLRSTTADQAARGIRVVTEF
jgi:hypothetical protein